jgi:hypothetical protein
MPHGFIDEVCNTAVDVAAALLAPTLTVLPLGSHDEVFIHDCYMPSAADWHDRIQIQQCRDPARARSCLIESSFLQYLTLTAVSSPQTEAGDKPVNIRCAFWPCILGVACCMRGYVLCAGPVCPYLQEWIQGPLQNEKIFLQGTDSTGRALAIVRVADHVADKKALKNMKLFVCYTMNAMVSTQNPDTLAHQASALLGSLACSGINGSQLSSM